MSDEQTNGIGLDPEYAKAHEYATAVRLRQEQQMVAARQEIEELRVKLAEAEAKLNGMDKLNDLYRDQLNMAITDRRLEMDRSAKYAALLSVMHTAMHEAAIKDFVEPAETEST